MDPTPIRDRATAAELEDRTEAAAELLAEGRSASWVATEVSRRYNVSRRQGRNYVKAGAALLRQQVLADDGADLSAVLLQTMTFLQDLAVAQAQSNPSAAVGAARTIVSIARELHMQPNRAMEAAITMAVAERIPGKPAIKRVRLRKPGSVRVA